MKALVFEADWSPREKYTPTERERATRKVNVGSQVWRNPKLIVKQVPEPSIGADDVLIRARTVGVCGSDRHIAEKDEAGYTRYHGYLKSPVILGHEYAGIVEHVGENVHEVRPGDFVVTEQMLWCGRCRACRRGFYNQCENLEEFGFSTDGAYAELVAMPARFVWSINAFRERFGDDRAALEAGALVEPVAVGYNALFVSAGGFKPGAFVAIFGGGPIGLGVCALAEAAGAGMTILFDPHEARRAIAKRMGAAHTFDSNAVRAAEVIRELTQGNGADVIVEATGNYGKSVPEIEPSLAPHAKVILIGYGGDRFPLHFDSVMVREGEMFGATGHAGYGTFLNVIRLIARGKIDPRPIVGARFPLDRAANAIAELARTREYAKVLIEVG
jgi:threonine dehydrogenase-like Zn-dependent dehydrogenase